MKEVWKKCHQYENYSVSNLGRVRRDAGYGRKKTRVMKQYRGVGKPPWYRFVRVCVAGVSRHVPVHRLVGEAFLGPLPDGHETNHMDGDPTNNRADNLEYLTQREHQKHSTKHGLTPRGEKNGSAKLAEAQVREIHALIVDGVKHREIAARFGVSEALISFIGTGRAWGHLNLPKIQRLPSFKAGKLSDRTVREIRRRWAAGETAATVGSDFGLAKSTVQGIIRGQSYRHVT